VQNNNKKRHIKVRNYLSLHAQPEDGSLQKKLQAVSIYCSLWEHSHDSTSHSSVTQHTQFSVFPHSKTLIHAPNQTTTISPSYITATLSCSLPIYKKGDKTDCCNYRGISILPITYKILSNILLSRVTPYAEGITGDHQYGFQQNR